MKKRRIALLLSSLALFPIVALAEEQSTELTVEIPSEYTLTIPATTKNIQYKQEVTELGTLKVQGNLAAGQKVKVTAAKTPLTYKSQFIPFSLKDEQNAEWTQGFWTEVEANSGKEIPLKVNITSEDWAKAKAGKYQGKIIFTSSFE